MNVPKLRFKEFDGEWEERKLEESVSNIGTGKSEFKINLKSAENKFAILGSTSIIGFDATYDYEGEFILTARVGANAGNLYRYNGKVKISDNTVYIQGTNLSFVYALLNKFNLKKLSFGTGQPLIKASELKKLSLFYPNAKEQNKIGYFLELLNKKIQLQQQKIDLLQEQKKGFLQKMFPKAGETQPEMRFKGYKDNWKQKKLEEVTSRVKGNDGRMELPTLTISASQGWLDQRERFSANIAGKEQKNYTLLKKGQLSYNHGNSKLAKYGVVFELDAYEEALVPRVYHSFETNNFADSKFIQYMFETKRTDKELAKLISSGARMDGLLNINYDEFMGITVSIPDIKEQKKIAEFFIMLNEKINREKEKVRELEKQKQGFMQQMFI